MGTRFGTSGFWPVVGSPRDDVVEEEEGETQPGEHPGVTRGQDRDGRAGAMAVMRASWALPVLLLQQVL